ncbi:hypothetical protein H0264_35640 [Nocardia huaxiensis]|uniref:Uncharacterized protein n=1 Tax=Nocardia huaxiensis TaxID=2755382 RepID=A0A7D6ZGM3_9NOCA|nr:hypothetical protein [Nocardia huaxiensis]QLY30399.1 hypothetical protein H0264_35640 [Nocardia huaxiensis]
MTQEGMPQLPLSGITTEERAVQLFRRLYGNNEPRVVTNVAIQITAVRDQFFEHWQHYSDWTEDGPENTPTDLWSYFDSWLASLRTNLFSGTPFPWLNPERAEDIWHEFVQLVPTIYVAIIDALLKDPAKLDHVERDPKTGKEIERIPRRITDVLPRFWQHNNETPEATPKEKEFGRIVWLVAGCGGSWPVVNYRQPPDRSNIDKWGPASG